MQNVFSLKSETALITGGGTGIGLGIARCLSEAGAKVVLVGRRESELRSAAESIGSSAHYLPVDITDLKRASEIIDSATVLAGSPISILVNNAGIHLKKAAVETTPEEFQSVIQTHVIAAHALSRAVLPGMIERRHGNILFTASMTSFFGMPLVIAYSAAKSALMGIVRSLSTEVSQHGVRVNAIAPGWIESDMLHKALEADPDRKNRILARISMKRFGQPDDIGHAAVYLCSPAARYVTGITLAVDGGASVGF
ncbi:MAG: 3-oxoacyl-ACP reductase [Phycisphaerae bacterium]|nr:MAG: 3-oxoacyl-ACP reductase [Phycisphaerae bacterium]